MIRDKIADRITEVSKSSLQNNSETIVNEHDNEIPEDIFIYPEKREKIIDDLRLIW